MKLSQKKKTSSHFFVAFLKFRLNLNILKQNTTLIDFVFPTQLTWQLSFDVIKVLWFRFQQCWGMFTMLLVEGFSQTHFFRHLSDYVLGVRNFVKTKSMKVMFFFKIFKIYCRFRKSSKKFRKSFLFLR